MQTIFVDVDAILAKRQKQARSRRFFGTVLLLIGLGGLLNVWLELHTLFTYSAVWAVGLALVGLGFLADARNLFRTNKQPTGGLTLLGQLVVCIGLGGKLADKWTGGHATEMLLALSVPLALALILFIVFAAGRLVSRAPRWFGSVFSRKR